MPAGAADARWGGTEAGAGASTESVLLTDPNGAVTRVAPWSAWTREQRRTPGGEAALITRLDDGQLWFSAGSSGSAWRHEVHVGPAVVTTPSGRFHAVAEVDGGATITCLAGRTRVATNLRQPALLEADQMVAVASDGRTLVVMEREVAAVPVLPGQAETQPERRRRSRLPEAAAVAALVAVLIGATVLYGRQLLASQQSEAPISSASGPLVSTAPVPTAPTISSDTVGGSRGEADGPVPERPVATTPPPAAPEPNSPAEAAPVAAARGTATGRLVDCRRSAGGVLAVVDLAHRSGGPGRYTVDVALVDRRGAVYATGSSLSPVVGSAAPATVEVVVAADSAARGACELTGITAR